MPLRVIAGEHRGRVLAVPTGRWLRPTSNRVREALFSSVQDRLGGARVLDLYAGSGALGIEALSRGAEFALFVESAPAALAALRKNLDTLGLTARSRVMRGDVRVALRRLRSGQDAPFDLVLVDPPYGAPELPEALTALAASGLLAPDARVVVESGRRHPVGSVAGLECEREWTYGDTVLTRWRATARPAGGSDPSGGKPRTP